MLQTINFDPNCNAAEQTPNLANDLYTSQLCSSVIYGRDVTVNVKPTIHTSGSSLVTTKNITNYAWEAEKIPGSLIAMHCSGHYIAYAIKGPNDQGMVRIIHCGTGKRGLIKNITGLIRDVAFAYLMDQILLACVDQFGSLHVHEVYNEVGSLRTELKLQVINMGPDSQRAKWWHESGLQRVVWCPYIPEDTSEEETDEDNCALLLTVTNGTVAEVWHLGLVLEDLNNPVMEQEPKIGYHMIVDHSGAITDAAFSPDGTALATASMDGLVKFFQMKFEIPSQPPRCLHQWNPHNSQPVSCLFFLDNYKHPNVDGLWKYAVTGANNNTELKTWSCQNWRCHQTIRFNLREDGIRNTPLYLNFKATIDPSSRYIILSDVVRRVLCIFILNQEYVASDCDPLEIQGVKFISVSEIPIQLGAICLAINDATFKIYKQWKDDAYRNSVDESSDDEPDMKIVEGLVIQCFLINQMSLQEAMIKFQPCLPLDPLKNGPQLTNVSLSKDDSITLQDGLTDLSLSMNATTTDPRSESMTREEESAASLPTSVPDAGIQDNGYLSPPQKLISEETQSLLSPLENIPLNLLTPESFNVMVPNLEELEIMNELGLHVGPLSRKESLTGLDSTNQEDSVKETKGEEDCILLLPQVTHTLGALPSTSLLRPQATHTMGASSSTSSPSLEVQQILHNQNDIPSLKNDAYLDTDDCSADEEKMAEDDNSTTKLVNIMPPFTIDENIMINTWESKSPLLSISPLMSLLTPDTMSIAKKIQSSTDKISAEILIVGSDHEVTDEIQLHLTGSNQGSPPTTNMIEEDPQLLEDGSQDSQILNSVGGIFQLKSLPPITKHVTCEQLEANIKNEMPVSKSSDNFKCFAGSEISALTHLSDVPVSTSSNFYDQWVVVKNELEEIKKLLNSSKDNGIKQLSHQTAKLATQLGKTTRQITVIGKQIDDMKKDQTKYCENLQNLVGQHIKMGMENTIKKEVKTVMYQATNNSMKTITGGIQADTRNCLSTLEHNIFDHISRITQSKQFVDNICTAISSSFSNNVRASVTECHNKILVPSFNASAAQMFGQMNEAFSRGTKEFINHVELETRAIQSTISDRLTKGCQTLESASSSADSLAKILSQNNGMTETVENRLRAMIREELGKAMQEQSALLEQRQSRSQTPMSGTSQSPFSVKSAQQQLQSYISRQEFNNAFKHALMLSDLSLVVFVCERVNPHQLFSHCPCPLTQEVLLSLINQLSYDLSTYTDLKIKYLEEAVMTLDMNHTVTKEHMRTVLGDCQRALTAHLTINPNQKKLKMLLLAVNQLLSSV